MAWQLVGKMGEPAVLCADFAANRDSLLKRKVRDMRAPFHAVDDEMVQVPQLQELLFRNIVHIGTIGYVAEAETKYGKFVMHPPYRYY